jgi:hypothetical protein
MGHQSVLATVAPAGPSRYGIQGMPERVKMNDISDLNRFIDRFYRPIGILQDSGAPNGENLGVKALSKRVLQAFPVIIAVKRRGDYVRFPTF